MGLSLSSANFAKRSSIHLFSPSVGAAVARGRAWKEIIVYEQKASFVLNPHVQ
jgi:hypothetical protein